MPTNHKRMGSHLSCSRVSAHLWHGLWACLLARLCGTALSGYESMLNSDSSIASSGSPILQSGKNVSPAHWNGKGQRAAHEANLRNWYVTRASDVEKYNWLRGTSRGNPFPMAQNILTTLKLAARFSDGSGGAEVGGEAYPPRSTAILLYAGLDGLLL